MTRDPASTAALTLALATAAGLMAQSLARKARIPGIVLLLAVGALLGPDVAAVIEPGALGVALPKVVGFAVAVILFEGGMHLELGRFRECGSTIRRLILGGAVVTLAGGTLAARFLMGMPWRTAVLFGSLVIVTGPTVVGPLIKRLKVDRQVSTILEAEGVLIDALGAVLAVVALEIALEPAGVAMDKAVWSITTRLGFGALAGLVGGFGLWQALRYRGLVGEGLENVFTLAMVWALYQGADSVLHESGIAAVTVAGLVVGNVKHASHRGLLDFNDQLTTMLIGMLFVLLAADVRLHQVRALGVPGLLTVAALVLVVRPVMVLSATAGSTLSTRQKLFIAWIGPRGIIAAAVASLFATELDRAGMAGGSDLKALVFLVIAVTVVLAGLTGGLVARLLGVSCPQRGWLLLGANGLSCALAHTLKEGGEEVSCVDSSIDHCKRARELGIEVILGNALEEHVLHEAGVRLRAGVAALTPNDEVNLLFIQKAKEHGRVPRRLAALRSADLGATSQMVHEAGGYVLFGADYDVELWSSRLRTGEATLARVPATAGAVLERDEASALLLLPLTHHRAGRVRPLADDVVIKAGDEITFVLSSEHRGEARLWLDSHGFGRPEEGA